MNRGAAPRRIWLCADDYGLSPGVNRAIRDLIKRGRLNATSVMVVGAAVGRDDEVAALQDVVAERNAWGNRFAVGLHVTLTAPFRPLTMHFRPADGGMFLTLPTMLQRGFVRRLDREIIQSEIATQHVSEFALSREPAFFRVPLRVARPVLVQHFLFGDQDDIAAGGLAFAHEIAAFEKGSKADDVGWICGHV